MDEQRTSLTDEEIKGTTTEEYSAEVADTDTDTDTDDMDTTDSAGDDSDDSDADADDA